MAESSFFSELRKRKVVQAAAIYGAVAWGVTEVIVTVVQQLFLPQWVATLAVIFFVIGFPVAMFLAWTFDLTSEGIRRTAVSSRRGTASIGLSMLLLLAGTAGLFFLIKPGIQERAFDPASVLPNSLAVLPFDNASRDPDDLFLSEGLSDELRDQLGRVPGLRIAARSSSIAVREYARDARSSSEVLGVAALLEGSLRREGRLLKVSVQLVEGSTGLALWTERFERGPGELPSLQQEIVERVVRHVLPEAPTAAPGPVTRNATASEAMLLARHYEQRVRAREEVDTSLLLTAIDLYREAVALDPDSALAHSRLAGSLLYLGDLAAAEAPIFRALSLQPDLSEVQHTLGLYYFARGMPEAYTAFRRAVELNPNNTDALEYHGYSLWIQGIEENVAELYRRALELDPLSLSRYGSLGEILGKQGRATEVQELVRTIEDRFDGPDAARLISRLMELTGEVDKAIAWGIRARNAETGNPDHVAWLAELYADIGDFDSALRLDSQPGVGLLYKMQRYDELIPIAEELMIDEPDDILVRYLLAFAYSATGQHELSIWVLKSTGLPETAREFPRMGADWEAYLTLMSASFEAGHVDVARELAQWFIDDPTHHENPDWFGETLSACSLSILGRDDEALAELELILRSPRLIPVPLLEDLACFRRFAGDPVYQSVVLHFRDRRAALRAALPAILGAFKVSL